LWEEIEGGNLSSDGGLVLLRQLDRLMGLTKDLAKRLPDRRDPDKIEHSGARRLSRNLAIASGIPFMLAQIGGFG
jgi:hypothetical protein